MSSRDLLILAFSCAGLGALLLLASAVAVLHLRRARVRPGFRGGCPTPLRQWWVRLVLPYLWFVRDACGYPIAHSAPAETTELRCPECGRVSRRTRLLHPFQRIRLARIGIVLLVPAAVLLYVDGNQQRRPYKWAPSSALIALGQLTPVNRSQHINWELSRRLYSDRLAEWQRDRLAWLRIRDLRSDDTRWNAHGAMDVLRRLGEQARPALLSALGSDDWQQRQLAMMLLVRLDQPVNFRPVDPRIRDVAIESLQDRPLKDLDNAGAGFRYLIEYAPEVRDAVVATMRSTDDPVQRFACAVLAGLNGYADVMQETAAILIPHLEDNDLSADAIAATVALHGYGLAVVPILLEARAGSYDPQLNFLVEVLLWDLGAPERGARRPINTRVNLRVFEAPIGPDHRAELIREAGDWLVYFRRSINRR